MIQYRNVLPNFVNAFKAYLCVHKSQQLKSERYVSSVGNFWEVSERVLQRIESPSAVAGRDAFCEYLNDTPWVAKRKGSIYIKLVSFIFNHVVLDILLPKLFEMYF